MLRMMESYESGEIYMNQTVHKVLCLNASHIWNAPSATKDTRFDERT